MVVIRKLWFVFLEILFVKYWRHERGFNLNAEPVTCHGSISWFNYVEWSKMETQITKVFRISNQ